MLLAVKEVEIVVQQEGSRRQVSWGQGAEIEEAGFVRG